MAEEFQPNVGRCPIREPKCRCSTGVNGGLSHKKSIIQLIIGVIVGIIGLMLVMNGMPPIIGIIVLALGAFIAYRGTKNKGVQMYV